MGAVGDIIMGKAPRPAGIARAFRNLYYYKSAVVG